MGVGWGHGALANTPNQGTFKGPRQEKAAQRRATRAGVCLCFLAMAQRTGSSIFFLVFCPHAYKRDQTQTLLTLTGEGLSQLLPTRPWRSPAESGQERVAHHVGPPSLQTWFLPPCEKTPHGCLLFAFFCFSNTTFQKHQFFSDQLSPQSNSNIHI